MMKTLTKIIAILTVLLLPSHRAYALDRPVSLPFELLGKKDYTSPARTSRIIDGTKYWALELPGIAQDGKVYYLPDARKLLLEEANIDVSEAQLVIACFSTVHLDILLKGSNTIAGKGSLISTKGAITISSSGDEPASLTLSTPQMAIQCATNLTLRNVQMECQSVRYALYCTGGRYTDSKLTIDNCTVSLSATKECILGFRNIVTVKCGLPYDEYEDQDISYDMRTFRLTHNDQPCLTLPLTNQDTFIPINTVGRSLSWQSKTAKPETAGEDAAPDGEEATPEVTFEEEPMTEEPVTEEPTQDEETTGPQPAGNDDNEVYDTVDTMPRYGDSNDALRQYLKENIRYPAIAQESNVQGRVIVEFIVETDGSVSNPTILKGVDSSLNEEALRLVSEMPALWTPGIREGQAVRTKYRLPVSFVLTKKQK